MLINTVDNLHKKVFYGTDDTQQTHIKLQKETLSSNNPFSTNNIPIPITAQLGYLSQQDLNKTIKTLSQTIKTLTNLQFSEQQTELSEQIETLNTLKTIFENDYNKRFPTPQTPPKKEGFNNK